MDIHGHVMPEMREEATGKIDAGLRLVLERRRDFSGRVQGLTPPAPPFMVEWMNGQKDLTARTL